MVADRIADMLTRIRNANQMKYDTVEVLGSKMTLKIAEILKEEGYIADYKYEKNIKGDKLKLTLKKARSTTSEELVVDKLLVNYGFVSNNNMVRSWGLDTDKRGITVDQTMMTSRPNIFAIGDAASYPGKTPLIATGWGEAPIAINAALNAIYPDRNQALHSTQLIKNFVKD